jgi:hypothetical protein
VQFLADDVNDDLALIVMAAKKPTQEEKPE